MTTTANFLAQRVRRAHTQRSEQPIDSVRLDYDARCKRRHMVETNGAATLLIDLAEPPHLKDGDLLECADGTLIRVEAAPEALLRIDPLGPADLVRLAWHLGNRHVPVHLADGYLLIREDHVLAGMLRGLGAEVTPLAAAFDPEPGAYHGHGHGHV